MPELARRFLGAFFDLSVSAGAICWLEPKAAPFVIAAWASAVIPIFVMQPVLAERDLRRSNLSAGLSRFYLDAMLGLTTIRCHAAERNICTQHEQMLGEWAVAALRYRRTIMCVEGVQMAVMFGLIANMLLLHPLQGVDIGRALLIVYWAMNLPVLGQELATVARQYPPLRNIIMRLLEPLGALEENHPEQGGESIASLAAPRIDFDNVTITAAGHHILEEVNLTIAAGSHVAIIGPSGAGKSSLVGMLLGHLKPSCGQVLVDHQHLIASTLRKQIAWVDPSVQLWNRSLFANVAYGSKSTAAATGEALDTASLRCVLESLPQGLQTRIGEGGGLLSGGEGQRVRFARATLSDNIRVVVLDEAFRGLDRERRRSLLDRARQLWRGKTLFCVTHDIAETRDFDHVIVIEGGRVVESGAPDALLARPASRYAELLEAEERNREEMWAGAMWRRFCVQSGTVLENFRPRRLPVTVTPKQDEGKYALHS